MFKEVHVIKSRGALPCGTFSYVHGFLNEKHVQRGQSPKKSRCSWDGVYLRTSITPQALPSDKHVEPAVNRQPGLRQELAEQNQQRHPTVDFPS